MFNLIFCHSKLRLATAIHSFKWLKISPICEIRSHSVSVLNILNFVSFINWLRNDEYNHGITTIIDIMALEVKIRGGGQQ